MKLVLLSLSRRAVSADVVHGSWEGILAYMNSYKFNVRFLVLENLKKRHYSSAGTLSCSSGVRRGMRECIGCDRDS